MSGLGAEVDGAPYRKVNIDPQELGRMFVEDALGVIAAKDGMSSAEEMTLLRYAPLFGLPVHEVRQALARLK